MNYHKILKSLKKCTYFNLINYYIPILEKKLKSIFFNENKVYLWNSSKSNDIFKKKNWKRPRF